MFDKINYKRLLLQIYDYPIKFSVIKSMFRALILSYFILSEFLEIKFGILIGSGKSETLKIRRNRL